MPQKSCGEMESYNFFRKNLQLSKNKIPKEYKHGTCTMRRKYQHIVLNLGGRPDNICDKPHLGRRNLKECLEQARILLPTRDYTVKTQVNKQGKQRVLQITTFEICAKYRKTFRQFGSTKRSRKRQRENNNSNRFLTRKTYIINDYFRHKQFRFRLNMRPNQF